MIACLTPPPMTPPPKAEVENYHGPLDIDVVEGVPQNEEGRQKIIPKLN